MIRRAALADIPQIVDLARESVSRDPLPVKIDHEAMADTARSCIASPAHFVYVAERDGAILACVAGCVQRSFWFRGSQCSVLLFFAKEASAGGLLLRRLALWIKARPSIKTAVFELEPGADERIGALLVKLGFSRRSENFTYVRACGQTGAG